MDRRVGWMLDKLQADGLADDTVIFFFADNGRLEARGIHWCYDTGLHVPLIIRLAEELSRAAAVSSRERRTAT